MTCYQLLIERANKKGDIVFFGRKTKIENFLKDVDFFANGLVACGLQKGDVVTIYLPTCPQSLVAFYACSKLGMIANLVHPVTPLDQLEQNLKATNSKALLFYDILVKDERKLANFQQTLIRCSIADYVVCRKPIFAMYSALTTRRIFGVLTYKQMLIGGNTPTETDGSAIVCYMHSGGTTGNAKIVKLTNDALNGTADAIEKMYHPTKTIGCYSLVTLPVFHAYGLCAGVHTPLLLGYSVILVPRFKCKIVNRYISKHNVTLWAVVPAMLKKMLRQKLFDKPHLRKLDVIWCGGDFLEESLVEDVDQILAKNNSTAKLMRGYGLTETCGVCVVNNYDFYQKGSCGKPMPNCSVKIVDEQGCQLPPHQKGEIILYSPGATSGYLDGSTCVQSDGGVKTGDIGYLDENGFLYLVDRKKRSVKIAAVNVFPSEVENCIKQMDVIADCCVVPYKVEGKTFLKAFVTLKNDAVAPQNLERLVIDHCKAKLMRYSVPASVQALDKLPLTNMAKVDYLALQKLAESKK
ncbi:MAG: acyl--CoA ligase [Clostridia bacterium]|nr:acyl--CoA ligase [Clostridia bacterium]